MAREIFNRRMHSVEQALKVAQQHNISRSETDIPADQLPDSELFLLGRPMRRPDWKICRRWGRSTILIMTKAAPC